MIQKVSLIFEHTYPVITKSSFSFPKFAPTCKKPTSSLSSFLRYFKGIAKLAILGTLRILDHLHQNHSINLKQAFMLICISLVIKEICACGPIAHANLWNHIVPVGYIFLINWRTKLKRVGLFITIFINDLSWYKKQFNTLKGFKICHCILLISKQPIMLHIF